MYHATIIKCKQNSSHETECLTNYSFDPGTMLWTVHYPKLLDENLLHNFFLIFVGKWLKKFGGVKEGTYIVHLRIINHCT
jgi:hypothetical protein